MNNEELEKLKELKTKQSLEKLKLKYDEELNNFGYNFVNIVKENDRYSYIEYKNTKGNDIRIWHDNLTGNTNAEMKIILPLENEEKHYKHISIKNLFEMLESIEKRDFAFGEFTKNYEPLLNNLGFTSNKDFVQYYIYDARYFYKDFENENKNAVMRIWYDNKTGKFSADLSLNDKKYENLSMEELFSILNKW